MRITRRFTEAGKSPYEQIPFRKATSEIRNPDGSVPTTELTIPPRVTVPVDTAPGG